MFEQETEELNSINSEFGKLVSKKSKIYDRIRERIEDEVKPVLEEKFNIYVDVVVEQEFEDYTDFQIKLNIDSPQIDDNLWTPETMDEYHHQMTSELRRISDFIENHFSEDLRDMVIPNILRPREK